MRRAPARMALLLGWLLAGGCPAAELAAELADVPPGLAGARVAPNLLLNLALDESAAGAAYPSADGYDGGRDYAGYFDARMCYAYPLRRRADGGTEALLDEAGGYFSVSGRADARHECAGAFSGNFMNWASASLLDILRYALSGGDRVTDAAGLTVLQRAYLPDGAAGADFYAHPRYFPRKVLRAGAGAAPGRVTPFDTAVLYIVSCRDRILFSQTADGGNCDTPRYGPGGLAHSDKYFGEYRARVRVCDAAEGPQRPDLCAPYGAAYKPAGSVQRHAGRVRFGLASYLGGQPAAANPYGGAVRAALDDIGPLRYDGPGFAPAPNARAEWSGASGVLAAGNGGVLNYINRLGRQGPAQGLYPAGAPLAELYYETLRYLQGRQPSAVLSAGDGFALLRPWRDPLAASCQRNAIVTLANGGAADDFFVPGNTRTGQLDGARAADAFGGLAALDAMAWTRRVGELEADPGGRLGNPAPRPGLLGLDLRNSGRDGRASYYMAGLAYWAHTSPIRPDWALTVDNFIVDFDAGAGTRDDSLLYLGAKYGGFADSNGDANPFRGIDDDRQPRAPDDGEWSAGGRLPRHYFPGAEPALLIPAVRAAIAAAAAPPGRVTGPAVVAAGATLLLQAGADPADWRGSLGARALAAGADGGVGTGPLLWEAGALLSGGAGREPRPAPAQRRIYTLGAPAGRPARTVPFEWAQLSDEQRAALDRPAPGAAPDGLGALRLDYLRGGRSREVGQAGGLFRRRGGVLGAALHAAPLYVGAPSAAVQGAGYAAFYARARARRAAVYLGADDGMLHAFDAADGSELFAYIPNALAGALAGLADTRPVPRPYVAGAAGAGEARLGEDWKTVLVSGMGGGARGVFALDISDPARFGAGGGALWEFTERDDAAIGQVLAAPAVARFKTGLRDGIPEYRYFAVVASGYNSDAGALFLLALDKPAAQPWRAGLNYYKLSLPGQPAGAANALGPPALVAGADGAVRYAYAGDLQGTLWRFDFGGVAPWRGAAPQARFSARDGAGLRQPITAQPKVAFAPGGGYLVLFGTGKFVERDDALPAGFQPQSFYALRDNPAEAAAIGGRAALAPRSLDGGADAASLSLRGAEAGGRGWYVDFPHARLSGERSVSSAALAGGRAYFNTILPGSDACAAPATRSYAIDILSGLAPDAGGAARSGAATAQLSADGGAGAPVVIETLAAVGPRGPGGGIAVRRRHVLLNPGPSGLRQAAGGPLLLPARPAGRLSWREVANWRELHEAAAE